MYGEAQSRPYATGEALPEHTPAVQSSSTSNFAAGMSSEGVASNGWSAYGHPDWQQSQQLPYDQQPGRTTDINPMDILQQFAFTNRIEAANAEDDIQSGTLFPGVTKFKAAVQRYIDAACPSTILCKDSHCAGWIVILHCDMRETVDCPFAIKVKRTSWSDYSFEVQEVRLAY